MASEERRIALGDWHPEGASRSAEAWLVENGGALSVIPIAGQAPLIPPRGAAEISARVGSIPRRVTFPDGSVFETWDNDGIDAYLARSGKGGAGLVHWLEQFRLRLAGIVVLAFLLGAAVYRFGLPALVELAVWATPPVVPELMSQGTLEALDQTLFSASELPQTRQQEITVGFSRLAAASPGRKEGYALHFRAGGAIGPNAFALPDGTIVMTDELVELAGGDTEMLMGVLAHEIGHVDLQHSLRQLYRAAGIAGLIMLVAGDIGAGAEDVLVDGSALLVLSYSRSAEADADRHSVELMLKAGYDPAAIARFFTLIEEKLGDHSNTSMLSTHPGTPDRRKAILDYAAVLKGQSDPDLQ